jgi:hypothetical protein
MSFEVEGKLYKKFDTENKTASFQAREFVIETEGTYPQYVKFQLTQDRCGAIEEYNEGENIKVHFDLRGREWNGKYFTNLNAWRIERAVAQQEVPNDGMPNTEDFPTVGDEPPAMEHSDDLPF